MAKPIIFDKYFFPTKKQAIQEARRRIGRYEPGQSLSVDDETFFSSLFILHSEYLERIGVGIDHIQVEKDFKGNKCLSIHRIDGTNTGISWVHCINPASQKTVASYAFRRAVKDVVVDFRDQKITDELVCPVLKIPLTIGNTHVVYIGFSFSSILNSFLENEGVVIDSVLLRKPSSSDDDPRSILADSRFRKDWIDFHRSHANLELMSEKANLSRKNARVSFLWNYFG